MKFLQLQRKTNDGELVDLLVQKDDVRIVTGPTAYSQTKITLFDDREIDVVTDIGEIKKQLLQLN